MNKKWKVSPLAVLLVLGTTLTPSFAASSVKSPSAHFVTDKMQFGNSLTTTMGFPIKSGHTYMMYFPIYQLMQILRANGYTVTWNGTEGRLNIITPEGISADLSNATLRRANAGIYLNDHLVQSFDKITQKDPKTGNLTTYLPLWDVQQALKRVGLQSVWSKHQLTVKPGSQYPVVLQANQTYGPTKGTQTINGNVLLLGTNSTVQNTVINGNVYINPGANGDVNLTGLTVHGHIIVESGANHSIHLFQVKANSLVISSTSPVHVVVQGNTVILNVQVSSSDLQPVTIENNGASVGNLVINGGPNVVLTGSTPYSNVTMTSGTNLSVSQGVQVASLNVTAKGSSVIVASGASIQTINVQPGANSKMTIDGSVGTLRAQGSGIVTLSGNGKVSAQTGSGLIGSTTNSTTSSSPSSNNHSNDHSTTGSGTTGSGTTGSGTTGSGTTDEAPSPTATAVVTWNPVAGATSYDIYENGSSHPIATGVTGTSYTVTGLDPKSTYTFSVSAVISMGSGAVALTLSPHQAVGGGTVTVTGLVYNTDHQVVPGISVSLSGTLGYWASTGSATNTVTSNANGEIQATWVTNRTNTAAQGLVTASVYDNVYDDVYGTGTGSLSTSTAYVTLAPPLSISTASLPSAIAGYAYSQSIGVIGGFAGYTYQIVSGTLPAGLSLNASTGVISGTPTKTGTSTFTIQVTDAVGDIATAPYSIAVSAVSAPALHQTPTPAIGSVAGTTSVLATPNHSTDTLDYQVSGASIVTPQFFSAPPSGLVASGNDLPAKNGDYVGVYEVNGSGQVVAFSQIPIEATDVNTALGAVTLTLSPNQIIGGGKVNVTGVVDNTYHQPVQGIAVNLSGTLGYWGTTGTSTNTVTSGENGEIQATWVTDPTNTTAQGSVTASVYDNVYDSVYGIGRLSSSMAYVTLAPPLSISTASLPSAIEGNTYSQAISVTGGFAGYTYQIVSGTLPAGLSLDASTGVISGTPTGTGTSTVAVQVTDAAGDIATAPYSIAVNAVAAPALSSSLTAVPGSTTGTTSVTATPNTTGDKLYYVVSSSSLSTPDEYSAALSSVLSAPTSGANLAVSAGDYVGVYEVNGSEQVMAFSQIPITSFDINVKTLGTTPSNGNVGSTQGQVQVTVTHPKVVVEVAQTALNVIESLGENPGTFTVTATPNTSGDTLHFVVNSNYNQVASASTSSVLKAPTSGYDLVASAGDYVGVYEVNADDQVVAYGSIQLKAMARPYELSSYMSGDSNNNNVTISNSLLYATYAYLPYDPSNWGESIEHGYYESILLSLPSELQSVTAYHMVSGDGIFPVPVLGSQASSAVLSAPDTTEINNNSGGYAAVYGVNSSGQIIAFGQIYMNPTWMNSVQSEKPGA